MPEDHEDRSEGDEQNLWAAAGEYTGYGLTWALSVLLFLLGGWWVDERLGTTPLLMIVGAFVGAGAGFYSLYRHVMASGMQNRPDRPSTETEDDERGPSG